MSTATLTWTIPITRTDGTPLAPSDVASVSVYEVCTAPTPAVAIAVLPGSPVTFTTDTLSPGVHDYTVVVTDVQGNASAASNIATVTVPLPALARPSAVTDLAAAPQSVSGAMV